MVRIAIAGATSQLAREVIDQLSAVGKHEVIGLIRKDPSSLPEIPGVQWTRTSYQDKDELVNLLKGVHTVLSFVVAHLDPGSETQKRIIDASVEAGVKRFAPSEWAVGEKLDTNYDVTPWYAGKVEVANYLKEINKSEKVIEYCRFQPGAFLDMLTHPHPLSKHVRTLDLQFSFSNGTAIIPEETLDDEITYTSTVDIAKVVARAVDYEGEWPVIGGISGDRATPRQLVALGEKIYGKPLTVDWLKMEDLDAGQLRTDNYPRLDMPSTPKDQVEEFSKMASIGMLRSFHRGLWTVTDEWNQLLPDLEFSKVDETLLKVWDKKPSA